MGELINGGVKEFIGITQYGAIWTNNLWKYRLSFNKIPLKLAISYLQNNCHSTLGRMGFRQLNEVGESDLVSLMANSFLY